MKNIEISILNYENQLLASRKQLNDLIYEFDRQKISHSLVSYKIGYLQNEIDYMNNQLNILRAELDEQSQPSFTHQSNAAPAQNSMQPQEPNIPLQNINQPDVSLSQDDKQLQEPRIQPQDVNPPEAVMPQEDGRLKKRSYSLEAKNNRIIFLPSPWTWKILSADPGWESLLRSLFLSALFSSPHCWLRL